MLAVALGLPCALAGGRSAAPPVRRRRGRLRSGHARSPKRRNLPVPIRGADAGDSSACVSSRLLFERGSHSPAGDVVRRRPVSDSGRRRRPVVGVVSVVADGVPVPGRRIPHHGEPRIRTAVGSGSLLISHAANPIRAQSRRFPRSSPPLPAYIRATKTDVGSRPHVGLQSGDIPGARRRTGGLSGGGGGRAAAQDEMAGRGTSGPRTVRVVSASSETDPCTTGRA